MNPDTLALAGFVVAALAPAGAAVGFFLKVYARFVRMESTLGVVLAILKKHVGADVVIPDMNGRTP